MDPKIKEELDDQLIELKIEGDEFDLMPFKIVHADAEIPGADTIDVDADSISISDPTNILNHVSHPETRHYSSKIVNNYPVITLHDVRQMHRGQNQQAMPLNVFNLVLTFKDLQASIDFCQYISQHHRYTPRL